jgi:hypothetical protein
MAAENFPLERATHGILYRSTNDQGRRLAFSVYFSIKKQEYSEHKYGFLVS